MTVSADVDDSQNVSLVSNDVQEVIDDYELPDGITVEIQGESVTVGDAVADLIKVILLALVLTYLIMVAQFQSLRSPFIVMFTIPLALTGVFLALLISGFDVSVIALLGFLVLTGVVVNNGIVLVDCINQLRLEMCIRDSSSGASSKEIDSYGADPRRRNKNGYYKFK